MCVNRMILYQVTLKNLARQMHLPQLFNISLIVAVLILWVMITRPSSTVEEENVQNPTLLTFSDNHYNFTFPLCTGFQCPSVWL